jgi:hypothetical protein
MTKIYSSEIKKNSNDNVENHGISEEAVLPKTRSVEGRSTLERAGNESLESFVADILFPNGAAMGPRSLNSAYQRAMDYWYGLNGCAKNNQIAAILLKKASVHGDQDALKMLRDLGIDSGNKEAVMPTKNLFITEKMSEKKGTNTFNLVRSSNIANRTDSAEETQFAMDL